MYQELAEVTEVSRFTFRDVKLAQAGPFLLLAGSTAACQDRVATIPVRQLTPVIAAVTSAGGQVIEGPSPAPNGDRVTIRHPDGSVFEYSGTASGKPPPGNPGQPREPPATGHQRFTTAAGPAAVGVPAGPAARRSRGERSAQGPRPSSMLSRVTQPADRNVRFCRWSRGYSWAFHDAWARTAQALEGRAGLRTGAPNPRQRGKPTRGQCSGSYLNES